MKLLYAEDERTLSEAVADILTYHNYIVDAVSGDYDGIILDIMMPKRDGLDVLSALRKSGCKTPVLLLTAKTQVSDRIRGLNSGADDYLPKPFAMAVVTILLMVLIGAISGLSWVTLDRQSTFLLHALTNGEERLPPREFSAPKPLAPPMDMNMIKSARFFTVLTDQDGAILAVNIDQISSVSQEQAEQYAGQITDNTGRIDNFKYETKQLGPDRLIFFLDTSHQLATFVMVLSISSVIAVVCWLVILLLVIFLSGRAVQPILAGIEKQKQFITNAGHELKTPLAIIQSNNDASALIYGETKYSRNIRFQTQRLNVLMANLLTLAKLDEEIKLPVEAVDISELIRELLAGCEDAMAQKQLTLSAKIQPHVSMQTHRDTFSQMVSVLLDNAVKYTPEEGTVHLSVISSGGHIEITEENTCEAPCVSDPERLFERFYRGDSARTQSQLSSGYGIGLSAARSIAETFGGKLTASYTDAGTIRFTARF